MFRINKLMDYSVNTTIENIDVEIKYIIVVDDGTEQGYTIKALA